MRFCLALLLSLILTLAAQSEAVARSEMAGATDETLCGTSGTVRVTLDATGHRIATHPCTHCLSASLVANLITPPGQTVAPARRTWRATLVRTAQTSAPLAFARSARAPPVLIL